MRRRENAADLRREQEGRFCRRTGRKRVLTLTNLLLALTGFVFLACASVVLVLNLRQIYDFDIGYLRLEEQTGLTREVIRENYDALIDYNLLIKGVRELEFPDFPMSENGAVHFREVKRIFAAVQCMLVIAGVVFFTGLFRKLRRRDFGCLKLIFLLTFLIPAVLGILAATNWETFFVRFHELFFQNDYWLFDPVTDPVILILPDAFFAHCAAAILLILFLFGTVCGGIYRILAGRRR